MQAIVFRSLVLVELGNFLDVSRGGLTGGPNKVRVVGGTQATLFRGTHGRLRAAVGAILSIGVMDACSSIDAGANRGVVTVIISRSVRGLVG